MFPCNNPFPKGFTLNSESSTPFTKSLVKNGQTFNTQASPQHTQALSLSLSLLSYPCKLLINLPNTNLCQEPLLLKGKSLWIFPALNLPFFV